MSTRMTVSFDSADPQGMTLHELHDRLGQALDRGVDGSQIVRVRTRFSAHRNGPPIRTVTVEDPAATS